MKHFSHLVLFSYSSILYESVDGYLISQNYSFLFNRAHLLVRCFIISKKAQESSVVCPETLTQFNTRTRNFESKFIIHPNLLKRLYRYSIGNK